MPVFKKDIPNDPSTLLKRIKHIFPDLNWGSYIYIDEGWDHEVIILDNRVVFRFPNDDQYSLKNEIMVLDKLNPLVNLAIPTYSYVAPDFSFAGYELVAGRPLSKQLFDELTADDRSVLAKQLADFLSILHQLPTNADYLSEVAQSDIKQYQAEMKQQADQYLKPVLIPEDFSLVQKIIDDIDKLLAQALPTAFLHGDIYNRHLLWDGGTRQLGIIDFSDMNIGDPAYDFAELYEYGQDFVKETYEFYTGPKDKLFLERAWTYQRWVGVFMMTDHFVYGKTTFEESRQTFDRTKAGR